MLKLWEISELMTGDKLFRVNDNESVDIETGEVFNQEYLDNLPMEQKEKSKNIGLVIKSYADEVDNISKEIKRLEALKKTRQNRVNNLKHYLLQYGCSVDDVSVTVKFSKGRESVEVDNDVEIPDEFKTFSWKPNKTEIGKALKAGKVIDGCRLIRKPTVSVK